MKVKKTIKKGKKPEYTERENEEDKKNEKNEEITFFFDQSTWLQDDYKKRMMTMIMFNKY